MADRPVLIEARGLTKHFPIRGNLFRSTARGVIKAVDGVSFKIAKGHSLGIAGESGCGKTTTGRLMLRLLSPTKGRVIYDGRDVTHLTDKAERKAFRKAAQLMFQNPYEALNPRLTVGRSILEPLTIHGLGDPEERLARTREALERVNLRPVDNFINKFPHQLSGGQLQRVVLARALVVEPGFLVADEPVSMLDVSVRAGVLNLMRELTASLELTTIYISHDLSLIQYMCQQTAIMYLGRIVELGPTRPVLGDPRHPYTQALIAAIGSPDPEAPKKEVGLTSQLPSPLNLPPGCLFQNRCPGAGDRCRQKAPQLKEAKEGHYVACFQI